MDDGGSATLWLGQGETALVWFPAVGDTVKTFGRTALHLTRRLPGRLRVVGFDPPGYAETDSATIPSFSSLYDWAALVVDTVGREARRVVVSGNSSGADLALAAAVRSRAPVLGCFLVCWPDWRLGRAPTSADLCPKSTVELDRLLMRSWHELPPLTVEQKQRMVTRLADPRYQSHVDSFDAKAHGGMLDQVRVPVVYVAGCSDGLVSSALVARTAQAHHGAFGRIGATGHYPQVEQPGELARLMEPCVRRWLSHQETW